MAKANCDNHISPLRSGAYATPAAARSILRSSLRTLVRATKQPDNRRTVVISQRGNIYAMSMAWHLSPLHVYGSYLTYQVGLLSELGLIARLNGRHSRMRMYRISPNALTKFDKLTDQELVAAWNRFQNSRSLPQPVRPQPRYAVA